ncbi:hypothetical protein EG328_004781 [Venturia inaequalis]|uniref:Cupin type-1 domain-containing protein n=1 Tax=Venturia inaequalis TaxID=5025 RepID=A0A8H3VGT1_VENIN|nr:hypothetical protein EG328_004781 [Venturia inaequalis]
MAVLSGTATIRFGAADPLEDMAKSTEGANEEGGIEVEAREGDVFVIPAGVAHKTFNPSPAREFALLTPGEGRGVAVKDGEAVEEVLGKVSLDQFNLVEVTLTQADWSRATYASLLPPEPVPTPWNLPKEYLSAVSPWFNSACKTEWQQQKSIPGTIQLDEVRPSTFSLFVEWLHGRKLVSRDGQPYNLSFMVPESAMKESGPRMAAAYRELFSLYQFSDQYDVPQLRRDIMDALCYGYNREYVNDAADPSSFLMPSPDLVNEVYVTLPNSSPVIAWLVDVLTPVFRNNLRLTKECPELLTRLPKEIILSIYVNTILYENGPAPTVQLCDYHEHPKIRNSPLTQHLHDRYC